MTCRTSYSQGPAQGYWFHPVGWRHQCLGLFGEWAANNGEESVLFSQFLTCLSPRLKVCQAQTPWLADPLWAIFSVPEWCCKEVGERWKHPCSLDQPDLLDHAGTQQILSPAKHMVATQKRRDRG